jgi:hypothetical protein
MDIYTETDGVIKNKLNKVLIKEWGVFYKRESFLINVVSEAYRKMKMEEAAQEMRETFLQKF